VKRNVVLQPEGSEISHGLMLCSVLIAQSAEVTSGNTAITKFG